MSGRTPCVLNFMSCVESVIQNTVKEQKAIAEASGGGAFAAALRPWLIPMRRLLFLRAITWCALWRVSHAAEAKRGKESAESTRDWSAQNTQAALIAHVKDRTDLYLSAAVIARMRVEWLEEPGLESLIG